MKNKLIIVFLFQVFSIISVQGQSMQNDTILNRYQEYLFKVNAPGQQIDSLLNNINSEGKWPDINYEDHSLADWKITKHLNRIRELSLNWANPRSVYYHDERVWEKINITLDHWFTKKYQSENWWYNEIGVPQFMRDIIILLRKDLDPSRLQEALKVMAQLKVRDNYVGGNLIWCADLGLHYGVLVGDDKLISRCRQLIIKEIKIGTGEGIQPDYSFHQHGKRLQMYQYGKAFLWESMRIAWELRNTELAFPEDKINILTNLITEGWQWMARGIHTVPGTMDRSSSRKGELRSPDLRPLIPFIMELNTDKNAELKKMEEVQNNKGSLVGYRYYPYSDFTAFHRPGFSFFLKTISTRTLATESINSENLKGKLLNSGDAYLIRNGEEYFDLLPAWDWTALPGLTTFKEADQVDRRSFVGSVSDKTDGLAVMDYALSDNTGEQKFSAHKFWACHQDIIICLIGNMKTENITDTIYTSLDQSRLQGNVTVNNVKNILNLGSHSINDVRWIHHAGFAYIPLQPASFNIQLREVQSNWNSINAAEIGSSVKEQVFLPKMIHITTQVDSAGYALILSATLQKTKRLANKPTWKVLRNGAACQAVEFKEGVVMASFYSPSKLEFGRNEYLQVDQACLILIKDGILYASDPNQKGKLVNIVLTGKELKVQLPQDGSTIQLSL